MPINSYMDIKLPAAPSTADSNLHGELLVLYNSLRNLMAGMSETYGVSIGSASAIAIPNNSVFPLLALDLPAGAWDVSGSMIFIPAAATRIYILQYSLATPAESFSAMYRDTRIWNPPMTMGAEQPMGGGSVRRNLYLSAAGTINLAGYANFDTSTCKAYGYLTARRVAG